MYPPRNFLIPPIACALLLTANLQSQELAPVAREPLNDPSDSVDDRIVVTATRSERELTGVPGSVQVITRQDIEDLGAVTLEDIVVSIVGLTPTNSSGRVGSFSLRGTGTGRTLVLVDGRRLALGFRDIIDTRRILMPMIERIEVVRGPTSALYGSDAIGGVINIITRKPKSDQVMVEGRYDMGDADGGSADVLASTNQSDFGAIFSGSASFQEELDTDLVAGLSEVDETDLVGGFGQAEYRLGKHHTVSFGGGVSAFERIGNRPVQGAVRKRSAEDERSEVYLRYEGNDQADLSWAAQANWSRFDSDIRFDPAAVEIDSGDRQTLAQLEGQINWDLDSLGTLIAGADYREEELDDFDLPVRADIANSGGFIQLDAMLGQRTNIIAGIRGDRHSEFGSNFAPRVAVVYWVSDSLRVRAAYGQAFKAPTLSELNVTQFRRRGREILLPNPDLDPETSESFEFGVQGEVGALRYAATGFYNDLEDRITEVFVRTEGSGSGRTTFLSLENNRGFSSYGAELELRLPLPAGFFAEANGNFLETESDEDSAGVISEPRWRGYSRIGWASRNGKIRTSVRAFYTDNTLRGSGIDVASNTVVGLHAEYRPLSGWTVLGGIENLTDEGDEENLVVPRQVYAGLRLQF